jgi:hypothetical protein
MSSHRWTILCSDFGNLQIAGMSLISLWLAGVHEICFGNPPPRIYIAAISDQRQDYVNQTFPEDIPFGFSSVYIIPAGMKLAHHCKYRAITMIQQDSCHDKSENAKRKNRKYLQDSCHEKSLQDSCHRNALQESCHGKSLQEPCHGKMYQY